MNKSTLLTIFLFLISISPGHGQHKAVFIIVDGIPADVIEKLNTPVLAEIAKAGGYSRAYVGGKKDGYSESPTISAVGYNHLLTGTWTNKHNVWDNDIKDPNYHYWNIFRVVETVRPQLKTAVFSTWTDNRTKLIGEGLPIAGSVKVDYAFDGFELDTIKFPHHKDRKYIFDIDEHVSLEAGRYIRDIGPDLSWVYLEFTDDMGHMFGDSPQFYDAIAKADLQIGRIWSAIKEREQKHKEDWMVVITTDHGRDVQTGKSHGKQSDRERTTWITTNIKSLNKHFHENPSVVDITPSLLRHLDIKAPEPTMQEMDGVPFIGKISIGDLRAVRRNNFIELSWKSFDQKGEAEVLISTTNNYKEGKADQYISVAKTKVSAGKCTIDVSNYPSGFYKILLKAPHNIQNVWVIK